MDNFAHSGSKQEDKNVPESGLLNTMGSVSTVAAVSKAENTDSTGSGGRDEQASVGLVIRRRKRLSNGERADALDLEIIDPMLDGSVGTSQSADVLERNRRSRSEERCVCVCVCVHMHILCANLHDKSPCSAYLFSFTPQTQTLLLIRPSCCEESDTLSL